MFNYKYIVTGNKVIALSTYAGKTVKGIAKCAPGDEFDVEKGKDLATARCANKIAHKRLNRAFKKLGLAKEELQAAEDFYQRMTDYWTNAVYEVRSTEEAVHNFEDM